jgi:hypothetical protein
MLACDTLLATDNIGMDKQNANLILSNIISKLSALLSFLPASTPSSLSLRSHEDSNTTLELFFSMLGLRLLPSNDVLGDFGSGLVGSSSISITLLDRVASLLAAALAFRRRTRKPAPAVPLPVNNNSIGTTSLPTSSSNPFMSIEIEPWVIGPWHSKIAHIFTKFLDQTPHQIRCATSGTPASLRGYRGDVGRFLFSEASILIHDEPTNADNRDSNKGENRSDNELVMELAVIQLIHSCLSSLLSHHYESTPTSTPSGEKIVAKVAKPAKWLYEMGDVFYYQCKLLEAHGQYQVQQQAPGTLSANETTIRHLHLQYLR